MGGWSKMRKARQRRESGGSFDYPPFPRWAENKKREKTETEFVVLADSNERSREEVLEMTGIDIGEGRVLHPLMAYNAYSIQKDYLSDEDQQMVPYSKKVAYFSGDPIDPRYEQQHYDMWEEREEKRLEKHINDNGSERGFRPRPYSPPQEKNMKEYAYMYIFNLTAHEAFRKKDAGETLNKLEERYIELFNGDNKYFNEDGNFVALFQYDAQQGMIDAMNEYDADMEAEGNLDEYGETFFIPWVWTAQKTGDGKNGPPGYVFAPLVEDKAVKDLDPEVIEAIEMALKQFPMKPIAERVEQMRYRAEDVPNPQTGVAKKHSVSELAREETTSEPDEDEGAKSEETPVAAVRGGRDSKW